MSQKYDRKHKEKFGNHRRGSAPAGNGTGNPPPKHHGRPHDSSDRRQDKIAQRNESAVNLSFDQNTIAAPRADSRSPSPSPGDDGNHDEANNDEPTASLSPSLDVLPHESGSLSLSGRPPLLVFPSRMPLVPPASPLHLRLQTDYRELSELAQLYQHLQKALDDEAAKLVELRADLEDQINDLRQELEGAHYSNRDTDSRPYISSSEDYVTRREH
ncbi:uncharacterized protein NECHADRAFT_83316 [Fusarium vanettenii 77-13-4]|uniref:Uncharacterized protein n=1 Tax=Fusarium vanettenii (strain ATCC MYA-4622 / CBS 123669 / FGSC 9596 / NRRL 45880 / 77-13-4) TaxID=660122 RepID=C7Z3N8_FUSV7|nr:uncharacterized protein NECHADRAFT_83316 [Fusarium vanettenii 77-13-4]EEU41170.1 predicted protein [Fusarium vanettenii 77-13-4]